MKLISFLFKTALYVKFYGDIRKEIVISNGQDYANLITGVNHNEAKVFHGAFFQRTPGHLVAYL